MPLSKERLCCRREVCLFGVKSAFILWIILLWFSVHALCVLVLHKLFQSRSGKELKIKLLLLSVILATASWLVIKFYRHETSTRTNYSYYVSSLRMSKLFNRRIVACLFPISYLISKITSYFVYKGLTRLIRAYSLKFASFSRKATFCSAVYVWLYTITRCLSLSFNPGYFLNLNQVS